MSNVYKMNDKEHIKVMELKNEVDLLKLKLANIELKMFEFKALKEQSIKVILEKEKAFTEYFELVKSIQIPEKEINKPWYYDSNKKCFTLNAEPAPQIKLVSKDDNGSVPKKKKKGK